MDLTTDLGLQGTGNGRLGVIACVRKRNTDPPPTLAWQYRMTTLSGAAIPQAHICTAGLDSNDARQLINLLLIKAIFGITNNAVIANEPRDAINYSRLDEIPGFHSPGQVLSCSTLDPQCVCVTGNFHTITDSVLVLELSS